MPANIAPIFCKTPNQAWDTLLTANTAADAASGTVLTVFTADATNGGRADKVVLQPKGTNVATVVRLFLNNGGVTTTGTNNILLKEVTMPATTVSQVAALAAVEVALNLALKPGYRILCTTGTTVAAGIAVSVHGGDY